MSLVPIGKTKEVRWSLTSKKDPRWNASGTGTVGMIFQTAPEAVKYIKQMEKKYGKHPNDLFYKAHMI